MIQFENISKTFHSGEAMEIKAVVNINLQINSGDFIVVVGANGSGKSTLLNLIAGTYHPDQGNLFFDKKIVNQQQEHQRAKSIARLFQNPLSGTAPELSIIENFRLAALRTSAKKISIGINQEFRNRVSNRIQLLGMGLENKLDHPMEQLSGGQRQALTLLMSTMDECKILLMDEPTSALDPRSTEIIMNLAKNIIQEKKLMALLVTHRLKDCIQFGNRVLVMDSGKIKMEFSAAEKENLKLETLQKLFLA